MSSFEIQEISVSAIESGWLMLFQIWGFHGGDYEDLLCSSQRGENVVVRCIQRITLALASSFM
jgi:hypothetical protein